MSDKWLEIILSSGKREKFDNGNSAFEWYNRESLAAQKDYKVEDTKYKKKSKKTKKVAEKNKGE